MLKESILGQMEKIFRSQHEKLKKCANHRALLGN